MACIVWFVLFIIHVPYIGYAAVTVGGSHVLVWRIKILKSFL